MNAATEHVDQETGEILDIRTGAQNKRLHAMLTDISEQIPWAGTWLDLEGWKRLMLGAFYGQLVVPNPLDERAPPIVINKQRSRDLSKGGDDGMADFLMALQAFGDERGVRWGAE